MVKELNLVQTIPHKFDPRSIVNEGPVYKGIFRVTIDLPEYERRQIKRFLEAYKSANLPPSRAAKVALHEGHGYEITQAEFIQSFEEEIQSHSDYKEYENGTIVAYGLEDPEHLIESYDAESSGNALVRRATEIVTGDQARAGKVLDMIVFNFKADKQVIGEVVEVDDHSNQETALKTFIR